jgi:hypothetical protein
MGEVPFDVPAALLATAIPGVLLAQLVLSAGHVRLNYEAARGWPTVIRTVASELRGGWAAVDAALRRSDGEDAEITTPISFITQIGEQLDAAGAEAEALLAEDTDSNT